MISKGLKGCSPALVTPFKADGSVDYDCYAKLVKRQVEGGADFLTALATTGETPTLSVEEKRRLLDITRECAGEVPILVGVGSNSVDGTLANIGLFPDADAYLVVVPFYNKPTQEGMFLYFKTICEHTDKPVVIYNVPGRTGANMLPSTAIRLAREVPGIIGIKEASGKIEQVREILAAKVEGFSVLSGDDDLTFEIIKSGGHGVISVAANILPQEVGRMTHLALGGRPDEAGELDDKLQPLYKACFVESNPIPVKEALAQMGLCLNEVRLPLTKATRDTAESMKACLDSFSI